MRRLDFKDGTFIWCKQKRNFCTSIKSGPCFLLWIIQTIKLPMTQFWRFDSCSLCRHVTTFCTLSNLPTFAALAMFCNHITMIYNILLSKAFQFSAVTPHTNKCYCNDCDVCLTTMVIHFMTATKMLWTWVSHLIVAYDHHILQP